MYLQDDRISKEKFIMYCNSHRHLIQPGLAYQSKIRKKTGGVLLWNSVTNYRKRILSHIDNTSTTLNESLGKIYEWKDPNKKKKLIAADAILAEQKKKIIEEAIAQEKEREEIEIRKQEEEELKLENRDDIEVIQAWERYHNAVAEFEDDYFSTDDVWERNESRMGIWELFDRAKEV